MRGHSLKLTAYHEAGHAVMSYWLHKRIRYVTIIPESDKNTLGHFKQGKGKNIDPECDNSTKTRYELERLAMIYLAGQAAECILTGRNIRAGSGQDNSYAIDYLSYLTGSTEELEAYWNWLAIRTSAILRLPALWQVIQALAIELLRKKYIGGRRAYQIIQEAIKVLPAGINGVKNSNANLTPTPPETGENN